MRKSRHRNTRALVGSVILAATATACAPIGAYRPGAKDDAPREPRPGKTRTASDTRVERDEATQSYARIEELIEGRAPGVRVIRHQDGSFRLQIRGVSSPAGRNDPLVVVDGSPTHDLHPGSTLTSLNPADVVRIDVLKDAASTAFYGMRGANGVILITTRQH